MEPTLTPDTQAVLLLCAELGQRGSNGVKPLGLRQYNALASWLRSQALRPGDLLCTDSRLKLEGFASAEVDSIRVTHLLDRGAALALMAERWERGGLWVISRSDTSYPDRLKKYLGQTTPPLLYGVGSKELLGR
ncbi:MAG: DNA-processing protein DprA, partial [Acidobacteriota bacterium]|nr:DNA-processing protein DprA [Acidobacteriota bacterium]